MSANTGLALITRAASFACEAHTTHRRKGDAAEPYVNHLAEVAMLLAADGADASLVAAGYLHDTLEDTSVTYDDLVKEFDRDVAELVRVMTDDESLTPAQRKLHQIESAPGLTVRAKKLRICDKISNLRALRLSPPSGWSDRRKRNYFDWAVEVVNACGDSSAALVNLFDETVKEGLAAIRGQK